MKYNQLVIIKETSDKAVVKFVTKQNGKVIRVRVLNYETMKLETYNIDEVTIANR